MVSASRLQVLQEHLQTLYNDNGFRWADTGRILGISERTLRRRRHEFGLPVGMGEYFTDITDDELDVNVREILQATPNVGQLLIAGGLRYTGRARPTPSYSRGYPRSRSSGENFKSNAADYSQGILCPMP